MGTVGTDSNHPPPDRGLQPLVTFTFRVDETLMGAMPIRGLQMTETDIDDRLALWDSAPIGGKPSAEQLCADRTDLLDRVRRGIAERDPGGEQGSNDSTTVASIDPLGGASQAGSNGGGGVPVPRNAFSV